MALGLLDLITSSELLASSIGCRIRLLALINLERIYKHNNKLNAIVVVFPVVIVLVPYLIFKDVVTPTDISGIRTCFQVEGVGGVRNHTNHQTSINH